MRKSKKIVALMLSIVMLFSAFSISAIAVTPQPGVPPEEAGAITVWDAFGQIFGDFIMGKMFNVPFSFMRNAINNRIFVARLIDLLSTPIHAKVFARNEDSRGLDFEDNEIIRSNVLNEENFKMELVKGNIEFHELAEAL